MPWLVILPESGSSIKRINLASTQRKHHDEIVLCSVELHVYAEGRVKTRNLRLTGFNTELKAPNVTVANNATMKIKKWHTHQITGSVIVRVSKEVQRSEFMILGFINQVFLFYTKRKCLRYITAKQG